MYGARMRMSGSMSSRRHCVASVTSLLAVVALACAAINAGCKRPDHRERDQRNPILPAREPTRGVAPVVKALGRIEALNMRVVTLEISPPAGQAIDVEFATQLFERHKSDVLSSDSRADAAIVKVAHKTVSGLLTVTRTESFVFAPDNRGQWRYTTEFDDRFSRLRL